MLRRSLPRRATAPSAPQGSSSSPLRLLDLSFDLVGAAGGSTASEADMRSLQGGGHDPKNQGFTVQNVELTFAGVVDPYLRGDASIVLLIDPSGETVIERRRDSSRTHDASRRRAPRRPTIMGAAGDR